jgi:hypothetical protein
VIYKAKNWFAKNERFLSPLVLIFGFVLDSLTLRRADLLAENIIIGLYLIIAGFCIFWVNLIDGGYFVKKFLVYTRSYGMCLIQFAFGGLFSAFTIFYSRSGSLYQSWPFLVLLLGSMISTEFLKKHYARISIQISVFYLALFSFLIFHLPIILKTINSWVFFLAGIISLILIFVYIFIIRIFIREKIEQSFKFLIGGILGIYFVINIMYFSNLIPPLPLVAKDFGVYHSLKKENNEYILSEEKHSWREWLWKTRIVNLNRNSPLYVFSSVFAPVKINAKIIHEWQYKDPLIGDWVTKGRFDFPILGGRDGGYRGYSINKNLKSGDWRVNILTEKGQLVSRINFEVKISDKLPELNVITK